MKIRRYLGSNTQEAILKVKMDLGNDAIILNTRKVRKKGLFKIFSKPMVEVLAAIDEDYGSRRDKDTQRQNERQVERPVEQPKVVYVEKNVEKPQNSLNDNGKSDKIEEKEGKISELENKVSNMESLLQKVLEQVQSGTKKDEALAQAEKEKQQEQERQRQQEKQQQERQQQERQQQERQQQERQQQQEKQQQVYSRTAQLLLGNITKSEVEADISKKLIEVMTEKVGVNPGINDAAPVLRNLISSILGKPETIKLREDGKPTTVIFVGPTGVGKTTTLAKVAASFALNFKKDVGFVTADTYRIAAVEQLKTYAEILGMPLEIVYSISEIKDAINKLSDKDLILIDTPGRSFKDKSQFEELKMLVNASEADEVYLVLSATTSMRTCREIINNYGFLKNYKLIFTKIDEAPVLGIILNIKFLTNKNLSYITNGQNVPDDIEVANTDKIAKSILGSIT